MRETEAFMAKHPVNQKRTIAGLLPATSAWFWGQGNAPTFCRSIVSSAGSAGDHFCGRPAPWIASLLQWKIIDVPNITGYVDTDYAAKGRHAPRQHSIWSVSMSRRPTGFARGNLEKKRRRWPTSMQRSFRQSSETPEFSDWRLLIHPITPLNRDQDPFARFVPWIVAGSDIEPVAGRGFQRKDSGKLDLCLRSRP